MSNPALSRLCGLDWTTPQNPRRHWAMAVLSRSSAPAQEADTQDQRTLETVRTLLSRQDRQTPATLQTGARRCGPAIRLEAHHAPPQAGQGGRR